MQKKARDEMVKAFEAELKELMLGLLEALMQEEQAMYLETHPTSANGYYTRDLLTLVGPVEDLKVPRVQEGDFHPRILPYRKRASFELLESVLALYAVGVSTRKISHFLEGIYGAFYSPQSISRLIQVTAEEVKAWRERPLSEEYYAGVFGWDFSFRPSMENEKGTRIHGSGNQARWAKGDPRVLALWCRREKLQELGGSSQGSQEAWGPTGADLHYR